MECSRHHVVTRYGDIENDIGDDCKIPRVKNQKDLLSGLSDGGWKEEQLMQNLKQDVHETFQGWHFFLKQKQDNYVRHSAIFEKEKCTNICCFSNAKGM